METAFEQLTKAVDEALEASEAALDIFNDIDFIQPALADLVKEVCSGQLIPDTVLSFSSASAGAIPPLKACGRTVL